MSDLDTLDAEAVANEYVRSTVASEQFDGVEEGGSAVIGAMMSGYDAPIPGDAEHGMPRRPAVQRGHVPTSPLHGACRRRSPCRRTCGRLKTCTRRTPSATASISCASSARTRRYSKASASPACSGTCGTRFRWTTSRPASAGTRTRSTSSARHPDGRRRATVRCARWRRSRCALRVLRWSRVLRRWRSR